MTEKTSVFWHSLKIRFIRQQKTLFFIFVKNSKNQSSFLFLRCILENIWFSDKTNTVGSNICSSILQFSMYQCFEDSALYSSLFVLILLIYIFYRYTVIGWKKKLGVFKENKYNWNSEKKIILFLFSILN